jgi:hypothetical protein
LKRAHAPALEHIVVDDGSSDRSVEIARAFGAVVCQSPGLSGPASARNLGAARARGELLLFLDADVCVHRDTLARIQQRFEADPALDALIGSYDDEPAAPGFFSQYKNLQHHFVHQHGRAQAATFWSGCGAIRSAVFRSAGGFDEAYTRPSVEDIELGYRLRAARRQIALDPTVQVKHLKDYQLASLLRSDIFDRALPWTRLILRSGILPRDLNLAARQQVSAALVLSGAALAPACGVAGASPALALAPLAAAISLNWSFCRFLARKKGWWFAARSIPLQLAYYFYSGVAFSAGAVPYLLAWPFRHRRQRAAGKPAPQPLTQIPSPPAPGTGRQTPAPGTSAGSC